MIEYNAKFHIVATGIAKCVRTGQPFFAPAEFEKAMNKVLPDTVRASDANVGPYPGENEEPGLSKDEVLALVEQAINVMMTSFFDAEGYAEHYENNVEEGPLEIPF